MAELEPIVLDRFQEFLSSHLSKQLKDGHAQAIPLLERLSWRLRFPQSLSLPHQSYHGLPFSTFLPWKFQSETSRVTVTAEGVGFKEHGYQGHVGIRANLPIPPAPYALYYFEVTPIGNEYASDFNRTLTIAILVPWDSVPSEGNKAKTHPLLKTFPALLS
jgi:hypothetical protein